VRQHLETSLQAIADGESEQMLVDGLAYRRHQLGRVKYHSLRGALHVQRWTFSLRASPRSAARRDPSAVPTPLPRTIALSSWWLRERHRGVKNWDRATR
jgi:hypothetical protein